MGSLIVPINLGGVNAYCVKTGSAFILFDCGFAANREQLEKVLLTAGVLPGNLNLLALTHGDIDHTGNCVYLRRKYGVPIAMHAADALMVEKGDFNTHRRVNSFLMRAMHVLFKSRFTAMLAGFEKFTPDLFLEEGQNLLQYGLDALILHTPGHTPGSLCFLLPDGDLISGDILQNRSTPRPSAIVDDPLRMAASLQRLKSLQVNTVYPGHGKPFKMSLYH